MNFDYLSVGYIFPVIKKEPITRIQLVRYSGASGDFNPLHTVEEVGEKAGSGIIAHGMLIMGMAGQAVTSWIPRKYVSKFKFRFQKMTFPGEEIEISGKVISIESNNKIVCELIAKNSNGEIKGSGVFEAVLPPNHA